MTTQKLLALIAIFLLVFFFYVFLQNPNITREKVEEDSQPRELTPKEQVQVLQKELEGVKHRLHETQQILQRKETENDLVKRITFGTLMDRIQQVYTFPLGSHDTSFILPVIRPYWLSPDSGNLIDIGANIGQTSAEMIHMFSNLECILVFEEALKTPYERPGEFHLGCPQAPWIVAFEPSPPTNQVLQYVSSNLSWHKTSWTLTNHAVSNYTGEAKFYYYFGSSEQGSFDPVSTYGPTDKPAIVPVTKLDEFVDTFKTASGDAPLANRPIFLLKIDTEGFDYFVLHGAAQLLNQHRVRFIVFEYNLKWFYDNRTYTLKMMQQWMLEKGYLCFWITPTDLIPISGPWWRENYEIREWSNCFCGWRDDRGLREVVSQFSLTKMRSTSLGSDEWLAFWAHTDYLVPK